MSTVQSTAAPLVNYLIPLLNVPQTFTITLAGVVYTLTSKWNDMGQYWCLDIADEEENPIVSNVPLVTGDDCLDGLSYLGIGGSLYVYSTGSDPLVPPTLATLGVETNLYFQTSNTNE